MVDLIDVSSWQDPAKFDWAALAAREAPVRAVVARATYGTKLDPDFKKFCEAIRGNGHHFGAYLFYRQTQTVRDQLAAFARQLDLVGGLMMGDLLPVLDMEHNARNGDGEPRAAQFSDDCRQVAGSLSADYGGCILYFSSYFPSYLRRGDARRALWMNDYPAWLADYGDKTHPRSPGAPRTPYTPKWALHQYTGKGRIPEYASGGEDLDLNVINPSVDWDELLIGNLPELEQEAVELEHEVNARSGGSD